MKVITSNLGQLLLTKNPKYIRDVIKKGPYRYEVYLNLSKYEPKKDFSVVVTLGLTCKTIDEKEEIADFKCSVVVLLKLENEEINKEDIKTEVDFLAISNAWVYFEAKTKLLSELNIDFNLPPPPQKEKIKSENNV